MSDIVFIRRNLKGMAFLGLWDFWKFENPTKKLLFNLYGKMFFFLFVVFNVTEFVEMYNVLSNILLLMGNAGISLLYFVTVFKAYTIIFKKHHVEKLLSVMHEKEKLIFARDATQVRIYKNCVAQNWFVTRLFWFVCCSTMALFCIARRIEFAVVGPQEIHGNRTPFVFSSWFPFDRYEPGYYSGAYSFQVFCGWIGTYLIAVSDTFIVACMIFAISQFRLVQDRIRRLHANADQLPDCYASIVDIIKEHVSIIEFITELDDLIKTIIFSNFLTCSLLIGSVGLEGIISGPSIRLGLNTYYLLALLIQLFLFYWHANEVSLESMNVAHAVSSSQWYRFSIRVQKALLLVMMRSQKPCTLSVGGFYSMSLSTFVMILKTTYSFLALFRKVYSRED